MSDWTDEQKQEVIEKYEAEEPTAETSAEIVKTIAEEVNRSPNSVRAILTRAGVYVKANPGKSASKGGTESKGGGGRGSKQANIDALTAAITDAGLDVNEEIVNKLTGKAAAYFAEVISKASES